MLELMAEGHGNTAVAEALVVTGGAGEMHVRSTVGKVGLHAAETSHHQVVAVLIHLDA